MNTSKYKRIILDVLKKNPVHPNANELYELVRQEYPEVGIATIYRNLDQLAMSGEVLRFNTDAHYDRYDGTTDDHYHMICTKCGKVYDIPKEIISSLDDKVTQMSGHQILEHRLSFKGICNNCSKDKIIINNDNKEG